MQATPYTVNAIERLSVGDERDVYLPHSEVCMHMRVAGTNRRVRLVGSHGRPMAQILNEDGSRFSGPITMGEAGFMSTIDRRVYCYAVARDA